MAKVKDFSKIPVDMAAIDNDAFCSTQLTLDSILPPFMRTTSAYQRQKSEQWQLQHYRHFIWQISNTHHKKSNRSDGNWKIITQSQVSYNNQKHVDFNYQLKTKKNSKKWCQGILQRKRRHKNEEITYKRQSERWMQRFIDRFMLCVLPHPNSGRDRWTAASSDFTFQ